MPTPLEYFATLAIARYAALMLRMVFLKNFLSSQDALRWVFTVKGCPPCKCSPE